MASETLWPFQSPSTHQAVSAIIRDRSDNRDDVRRVSLCDLDLSSSRNVLDLGCGFGFMAEALARRAAPGAQFVGVDVWQTNAAPFLDRVTATGREASFVCMRIGSKLPWPDRSFDLVVCSYSLYFFAEVLPEVSRLLAPDGLFLTITHSESSFVGLLRAAGLEEDGSSLLSLTRRFSAENGRSLLDKWFGDVARVDYHNCLRFRAEHAEELLAYLKFKLPLLVPGSKPGADLPESVARFAMDSLSRLGEVVVEKTDAAFRCRSPLWD